MMFGAIANGPSIIRSPLTGEDCLSTLGCLAQLGLKYEWVEPNALRLVPASEWVRPTAPLDCGNSGTTMRLLAGLVASRRLDVTMIGDSSLSKRPMKRIAEPLRTMGARLEGDTPPLHVVGGDLQGIEYVSPVASGQIKSCTLLAGLRARGRTSVTEPALSRDHTERMLRALGIDVRSEGLTASVEGGQQPIGFEFTVPGDISSAAFSLVAASIVPEGHLELRELGLNGSRTGVLDVLHEAGVKVDTRMDPDELGEPMGTVAVEAPSQLSPFKISGSLVPRLIDEIPVLAVLATQCDGVSEIRDASELRVKESDRIEVVADGLRRMGALVETFSDGMRITGPTRLSGADIDASGDHRIAMAFYVAGLISDGQTVIHGSESVHTSYPAFEADMRSLLVE